MPVLTTRHSSLSPVNTITRISKTIRIICNSYKFIITVTNRIPTPRSMHSSLSPVNTITRISKDIIIKHASSTYNNKFIISITYFRPFLTTRHSSLSPSNTISRVCKYIRICITCNCNIYTITIATSKPILTTRHSPRSPTQHFYFTITIIFRVNTNGITRISISTSRQSD